MSNSAGGQFAGSNNNSVVVESKDDTVTYSNSFGGQFSGDAPATSGTQAGVEGPAGPTGPQGPAGPAGEANLTVSDTVGTTLPNINTIDFVSDNVEVTVDPQDSTKASITVNAQASGPGVYIQDTQPTDPNGFVWIQTNVNENGDYSFWFCK